jgi:SAM-dependent methyltransferase
MLKTDYIHTYRQTLQNLIAAHGETRAMDLVVGGQSEAIGALEFSTLKTAGLQPHHSLIDVGCGSGRLAVKLAPWLTRSAGENSGKYTGCDILPEIVAYAAKISARPDWEFHTTEGAGIPAADGVADMVCFFSVFTHLHDDDIYRYLAEAKRVTKPGGKIVFSYLDYAVATHWAVFAATLADSNPNRVLNQFVSKDAIATWCQHLGLKIERLWDGPEKWIKLDQPITYIDGRVVEGTVEFGQSVAIVVNG